MCTGWQVWIHMNYIKQYMTDYCADTGQIQILSVLNNVFCLSFLWWGSPEKSYKSLLWIKCQRQFIVPVIARIKYTYVALLIINRPEIHQDFYFEMSMICYVQLLIQKA